MNDNDNQAPKPRVSPAKAAATKRYKENHPERVLASRLASYHKNAAVYNAQRRAKYAADKRAKAMLECN